MPPENLRKNWPEEPPKKHRKKYQNKQRKRSVPLPDGFRLPERNQEFDVGSFLLEFLPAFGIGLGFLLALAELLDRRADIRKVLLAGLYFSWAALLLHGHLFHSGTLESFPYLFRLHIPLALLAGPLLWLYIRLSLDEDAELETKHFVHFVPFVIASLVLLPGLLKDRTVRLEELRQAHLDPLQDSWLLLFFVSLLALNIYVLASVARLSFLFRSGSLRDTRSAGLLVTILIFVAGFIGLVILGVAEQNAGIGRFQLTGMTLLMAALFLTSRAYPEFFYNLRELDRRAKYAHPQLNSSAIEKIDRRLEKLMQADRVYQRDTLGLSELAALLEISTHRLSEYFNLHRKTGFRRFLNQQRIAQAKELLVDEPGRTVLSIGYEVGFNSKSAFNRVFLNLVGMNPSDYRRRYRR